MIVFPLTELLILFTISLSLLASNDEVASSRKRMSEFLCRALAISSLCFCPHSTWHLTLYAKEKNRIFGLRKSFSSWFSCKRNLHQHSTIMTRETRLIRFTHWLRRPNCALEQPSRANFDCEISLQPSHKGRFALRNRPFQDAKRSISRCKTDRFGKQKGINCKSLIFNA